MSRSNRLIIGGVDAHAATHHAAVIDLHGRLLADAQFPATPARHRGTPALTTRQARLLRRGRGLEVATLASKAAASSSSPSPASFESNRQPGAERG